MSNNSSNSSTQVTCDNFSPKVVQKLAERAGYVCSNPLCNRLTIGPDDANPIKSTKTGVAAHICAASQGGPRHDPSQTSNERKSISNGIWLCATCSTLIDKNGGNAYSVDDLRKWKNNHEELIKSCLAGEKKLAFLPTEDYKCHHTIADELLIFMEDRGVLFVEFNHEYPRYIINSIDEIRIFLIRLQARPNRDKASPLAGIVKSITNACRDFMNKTPEGTGYKKTLEHLGVLRKSISLDISKLVKS